MDVNPEYINSFVTLIVGFVAWIVYYLAKVDEKRKAAIILVMDIRHAEQVLHSILEKGFVDTFAQKIISENNWGKYKHLFAVEFTQDDFEVFNRFFNSCTEIVDAQYRMMDVLNASLVAKAESMQQKILSLYDESPNVRQQKKDDFILFANQESFSFDPDDPKSRIFKNIQIMGKLSNTIAFEKLKEIAKIR